MAKAGIIDIKQTKNTKTKAKFIDNFIFILKFNY